LSTDSAIFNLSSYQKLLSLSNRNLRDVSAIRKVRKYFIPNRNRFKISLCWNKWYSKTFKYK